MKKLVFSFFVATFAMMSVSCGNTTGAGAGADSLSVDSVAADSLDSVNVDTVAVLDSTVCVD